MVLTRTRSCQVDCLVTIPSLVVVALTLLTIRVSNIVRVLLLKLLVVDVVLLCELLFPEPERLIHCETEAFEEQAELQSPIVLQMVLVLQSCVQCLHARWEMLP